MLVSPHDYATGANVTCREGWHDLRSRWPSSQWRHLRFACFSGTYIARLLTSKYRLEPSQRALAVSNKIAHTTLDWTLGSLLHDLYLQPKEGGHANGGGGNGHGNGHGHAAAGSAAIFGRALGMHDASPGAGAEMMIMSKPMVEAGSTLDRLCSMRLTGLLGLMPTGLCVLSSSWALALMLFAWLAGSVRLAMRICGGSAGGLRGGPRSPKHSNARGSGRGQSHTV